MKKLPCKQRNGPQNGVINIQAVGYNGMSTAIVLYFTTIIAQLLHNYCLPHRHNLEDIAAQKPQKKTKIAL